MRVQVQSKKITTKIGSVVLLIIAKIYEPKVYASFNVNANEKRFYSRVYL